MCRSPLKILAITLELLQSRGKAIEDGMRRLGPNSGLTPDVSTFRWSGPVEAVHLLGAAIGQDTRWDSAGEALSGVVHNYHSHNDVVLGRLYPAAMGGRKAIGFEGLDASFAVNHDVSEAVKSHSAYYENVELISAV